MDRRSFLRAAPLAVVTAPFVSLPASGSLRVSCRKGDPGERLYAQLCADDKVARVYLDGVYQRDAVTADEGEGIVVRAVRSPNGNIAFNRQTSEVYEETVRGHVRIDIEPKAPADDYRRF